MTPAAEEAAGEPGRTPFPLWDFSGFNELTTEALPPGPDPTSRMRWHDDTSHYSREHGNLILERIFQGPQPAEGAPAAAAVRLNARNIDAHLGRIRLDANGYRAMHSTDVAEVGATVQLLRRFVRQR